MLEPAHQHGASIAQAGDGLLAVVRGVAPQGIQGENRSGMMPGQSVAQGASKVPLKPPIADQQQQAVRVLGLLEG